jgi:phosphoesterase RecJ-like protein
MKDNSMASFKTVWQEINKHQSFLVTTHHNPDADAACSALAMAIVLKKLGKKVLVVNEDALPSWLSFLPQAKIFQKKANVKKVQFDGVIILDCGDYERMGGVSQLLNGQRTINIDHHVTNRSFGNVNVVSPKASSTCEMLFDCFKEGKIQLTKDISLLLYAGIMTDTGSFRYDNTTAKTHAIIAELMKFGLSAPDLHQRLYVGIPSADIKRYVDVIHSAELLFKNKLYCVSLPKKLVDDFSDGFDLKEKIFGFLRGVEGVELVVILTEVNSELTRINLRSQNNFDVAQLASQFNGGGHRKAAGAKMELGLEATKKKLLATIKKTI